MDSRLPKPPLSIIAHHALFLRLVNNSFHSLVRLKHVFHIIGSHLRWVLFSTSVRFNDMIDSAKNRSCARMPRIARTKQHTIPVPNANTPIDRSARTEPHGHCRISIAALARASTVLFWITKPPLEDPRFGPISHDIPR